MTRLKAFLPIIALALLAVVLIASGVFGKLSLATLSAEHARFTALIAAHPWLSAAMQIGFVALITASGLPGGVVLNLAAGVLFGPLFGALLCVSGLVTGASLLFLASRRAFSADTLPAAPALVEKVRAGYQRHPLSYALFLRLVPAFPFGAVTVALAWLRCPFWLFLLSATVGGAATVLAWTHLGAGLADSILADPHLKLGLFGQPRILVPLLALGLLALLPIVLQRFGKPAVRAAQD